MYRAGFYLLINLLIVVCDTATAQVPRKRLPGSINMPTASQIYPSLTGDGTYMVFYSNYTNAGDFQLMYSKKMRGGWDRGTAIEMYRANLDHIGSHCVSYDGQFLYFSSMRSQGIGGFDIWYSERQGDTWGAPRNIGKPVNTSGHEGHPSLSADGRTLYFIRCEKMDVQNKEKCSIWVAHRKSSGMWAEPERLPAPVNQGHETSPRILLDNETLVFASDRPGGAGRQDLYITRREDVGWTRPLAMDFLNTAANNEYISIPAGGNIVYYTDLYKNRHHLYKAILPEEFRPKKILLMTGRLDLSGLNDSPDVRIQAYNAEYGGLFSSVETAQPDKTFFMTLPQGSVYDFSVFPVQAGYTYYASLIDMTAPRRSDWVRPEVRIEEIGSHAVIREVFTFEPGSPEAGPYAQTAFKRLAGFLRMNPGYQTQVTVLTDTTGTVFTDVQVAENSTEIEGKMEGDEAGDEDDWIDDSAWFGSEENGEDPVTQDSTSLAAGRAAYDPALALDRAMTIVNELQVYGCDISMISPGTDFAQTPFDRPVADSLGYIVEIRLSR